MEEVLKERLNWHGRFLDYNDIRYFNYSASGFSFKMRGKSAEATFISDADDFNEKERAIIGIYAWEGYDDSIENIPETEPKIVILNKNETKVSIFNEFDDKNMCIFVIKLTEAQYASTGLKSLNIDGSIINSLGNEIKREKIEVIGDSITCGYGVNGKDTDLSFSTITERSDKSYPFLLAKKMKAELMCVSWSGIGITSHWIEEDKNIPDINLLMGSLWSYTDKEICRRLKIDPIIWDENKFSPDTIIINLGTNDASFIKNMEDRRLLFVAYYKDLIERIHIRSPKARIICTYGVMEQSLQDSVKQACTIFKNEFKNVDVRYIPLELQRDEDGKGTCGHPSIVTQERICETLYKELTK